MTTPSKSSSRLRFGKKPSKTGSATEVTTPSGLRKKTSETLAARLSVITKKKDSDAAVPKNKTFDLPAFSVAFVPKRTDSELDQLKKKTIRRNAPPGEDIKQIKSILKSIKGQKITVQEFIALVAPSTGDMGETLRLIMNDDLNAFRKLARKVYETITQDNSDVLLNQQMQLAEYYKEKKMLLQYKLTKTIDEIYTMAPNINFDRYASEREEYLKELLPIPQEVQMEPEEMELLKRQAAFHRLQWLKSEGERLNEENNSLKKHLEQLKHQHLQIQSENTLKEQSAEHEKEQLKNEEARRIKTLDTLNKSLEKEIVQQEISIKQDEEVLNKEILKTIQINESQGAIRKKKSAKGPKRKKVVRPEWNSEIANELEEKALNELQQSEIKRSKSPQFEFVTTPPHQRQPTRQISPFHYSPPKDEGFQSQAAYVPEPSYQTPTAPRYGRMAAARPKDQWNAYY